MKTTLRILSIVLGLTLASTALAATYTPIVGFPGLQGNSLSAEAYIKAMYSLAITVAGLLAVVKIIFSGVRYMLSDVITTKGDALRDIRGALLGLLIVLSAVLILTTINPKLTTLSFLGYAPALAPVSSTEQTQQAAPQTPQPDNTNGVCLQGQTFVVNATYPNGACQTTNNTPLSGQDYTNNVAEGNYACTGVGTYDPTTNTCVNTTVINKVPASIIQQNADLAGGTDNLDFLSVMQQWCQAAYSNTTPTYDAASQSCVPLGGY